MGQKVSSPWHVTVTPVLEMQKGDRRAVMLVPLKQL